VVYEKEQENFLEGEGKREPGSFPNGGKFI
jgi:hypothetical protein